MLNESQRELLWIAECFMHGKEYHLPETFSDMKGLYLLAAEHKLGATVYEMIRREPQMSRETTRTLAVQWKRGAVKEVMLQIQRTEGFLDVYRKLREHGVKPLLVKGIICRALYPMPDYRVSGDEDVLVRREEFELCDAVLLEAGMQRGELDMEHLPYEIPYINPTNGGYIELHFTLFAEESGAYGHLAREFATAHDTCVKETIQGTDVWTLNPTLHLFYLVCHALKHFLHSGFGIRQVCDMVMMAERYGTEIDWKYIRSRMEALRMEYFWDGLVEIGREYLGFSMEKAHYPEKMQNHRVNSSHLLIDLLDSGVYGDSSMERKHSSNVTLAAAEKGEKNTVASLKASLFPGRDYMKGRYPWVGRHLWLLPVAWVMRMVGYVRNSGKQNKEEPGSMEIGMDRVELLREYHLIK